MVGVNSMSVVAGSRDPKNRRFEDKGAHPINSLTDDLTEIRGSSDPFEDNGIS